MIYLSSCLEATQKTVWDFLTDSFGLASNHGFNEKLLVH
jgi:hypothetical protein